MAPWAVGGPHREGNTATSTAAPPFGAVNFCVQKMWPETGCALCGSSGVQAGTVEGEGQIHSHKGDRLSYLGGGHGSFIPMPSHSSLARCLGHSRCSVHLHSKNGYVHSQRVNGIPYRVIRRSPELGGDSHLGETAIEALTCPFSRSHSLLQARPSAWGQVGV